MSWLCKESGRVIFKARAQNWGPLLQALLLLLLQPPCPVFLLATRIGAAQVGMVWGRAGIWCQGAAVQLLYSSQPQPCYSLMAEEALAADEGPHLKRRRTETQPFKETAEQVGAAAQVGALSRSLLRKSTAPGAGDHPVLPEEDFL